jgi:hypothetical protein
MGRDKPKDYEKMNFHQKRGYLRGQAQKYGISESDFQDDEGNHKDRLDSFLGSSQSMENAVVKAMNADYDMRESLKYGIDSGNKHFKDATYGISNINEAVNAHQAIQKYGKKDLKHKNTSSANDYADISHNLFKESRDNFQGDMESSMEDKYATADKLNALQDKIKERAEQSGPVEISSTLTNAQRDIGAYDEDKTSQGANIFGAVGEGNDLQQATEEVKASEASGDGVDYKDKYAANVKAGLDLSGIMTRGPGSGINGEGF